MKNCATLTSLTILGAALLMWGHAPLYSAVPEMELPPRSPIGTPPEATSDEDMSGYYVIENELYYYDQQSGEFISLGKESAGKDGAEDTKARQAKEPPIKPPTAKAPEANTPAPKKSLNRPVLSAPIESQQQVAPKAKPKSSTQPAARLPAPAMNLASEVEEEDEGMLCGAYRNPMLAGKIYKKEVVCQLALEEKFNLLKDMVKVEREGLGLYSNQLAGQLDRSSLLATADLLYTRGCDCAIYIDWQPQ